MEKQTPIFMVCLGNPWGWNETILKMFYSRTDAEAYLRHYVGTLTNIMFLPYVYIREESVTSVVPDVEPEPAAPEPPPPPPAPIDPEEPVAKDNDSWLDNMIDDLFYGEDKK